MRFASVVLGICVSASAFAAGKKEFRAESSKDPRSQSDKLEATRSLIEKQRHERLHLALELAGIKKSHIVQFNQTATPEQRQELAKLIGDLSRAEGYVDRQERIREIRIHMGLFVPKAEAQPEIHYNPADPVEVRRSAMRDITIPESAMTPAAYQHVAKNDSDAEVRRLAHERTRIENIEELLRLSSGEMLEDKNN